MLKAMVLIVLVTSLVVIAAIQQQAKAVFPTTEQKYQQDVLKARFLGFQMSCANELHVSPDNLTMDQAQQCPKAYADFKELTGGSDSDIIGMIVDELRGHSTCKGIALSNEVLKKANELLASGPNPHSIC